MLDDNLLEIAETLTATNAESFSSAANLYHPYMEHALNCDQTSTTISGVLLFPKTISCIALAYHNAEDCVVRLYDGSNTLLLTETIALETYDNIYYFTSTADVYRFEVDVSGAENVYVGYMYLGAYTTLPRFDSGYGMDLDIRSSRIETTGGQVSGMCTRSLKTYSLTWAAITNAEREAFETYLDTVQTCKPHMIDLFHLSHASIRPVYVTVEGSFPSKALSSGGLVFSASLKYKEAR